MRNTAVARAYIISRSPNQAHVRDRKTNILDDKRNVSLDDKHASNTEKRKYSSNKRYGDIVTIVPGMGIIPILTPTLVNIVKEKTGAVAVATCIVNSHPL